MEVPGWTGVSRFSGSIHPGSAAVQQHGAGPWKLGFLGDSGVAWLCVLRVGIDLRMMLWMDEIRSQHFETHCWLVFTGESNHSRVSQVVRNGLRPSTVFRFLSLGQAGLLAPIHPLSFLAF